jgi:hypothetical protein
MSVQPVCSTAVPRPTHRRARCGRRASGTARLPVAAPPAGRKMEAVLSCCGGVGSLHSSCWAGGLCAGCVRRHSSGPAVLRWWLVLYASADKAGCWAQQTDFQLTSGPQGAQHRAKQQISCWTAATGCSGVGASPLGTWLRIAPAYAGRRRTTAQQTPHLTTRPQTMLPGILKLWSAVRSAGAAMHTLQASGALLTRWD